MRPVRGGSTQRSSRYTCTRAMPCTSFQGMHSGMRARASGSSSRMTNHISQGRSRLPVRPMRCRKLLTVNGASIWKARSSLPMSMPSSRVAVVTVVNTRSSSRMASSALSRSDEERLPWWMRKRSGWPVASQYWRRLVVTASASSRELTKTRHLASLVCSKI